MKQKGKGLKIQTLDFVSFLLQAASSHLKMKLYTHCRNVIHAEAPI